VTTTTAILSGAGTIALLLLKIWLEHIVKEHGWGGLVRSIGHISLVALIILLGLLSLTILYSIVINIKGAFDFIPEWGSPRFNLWIMGVAFPASYAFGLFFFRKYVMMFLSAILLWAWTVLVLHTVLTEAPTTNYAKYLANSFEHMAGWTTLFTGLLTLIALSAHAIATLHKVLEAGDRQ
jgi:hypothetical protein